MAGTLITGHREFDRVIAPLQRIAVLGIKPEHRADRPAHIVPSYLQRVGYRILPVPVYYPEVEQIFGERVYRRVSEIRGRVDLVNVFRKPTDLMPHLDDLVAARPRTVWMQTGIHDDAFTARLLAAGIDVVQDECLMVEDRRWRSSR